MTLMENYQRTKSWSTMFERGFMFFEETSPIFAQICGHVQTSIVVYPRIKTKQVEALLLSLSHFIMASISLLGLPYITLQQC